MCQRKEKLPTKCHAPKKAKTAEKVSRLKLYTLYSFLSIYLSIYLFTHIYFTTEGFVEVAIESWLEWDLNPRPMNSVQTL